MTLDDLIEFLYRPHPNAPRCSHCRRPLFPVKHEGKQFFYCKHCAELAEKDKTLENESGKYRMISSPRVPPDTKTAETLVREATVFCCFPRHFT